jgi:hypothetical protein
MAEKRFYPREFKGKQHNHGCADCNGRYVCCCETPEVNGRCNPCISGIPSTAARAMGPRRCCYEAMPITPIRYAADFRSYKLAGPGPWFKCPTCARTFPAQPEKVRVA